MVLDKNQILCNKIALDYRAKELSNEERDERRKNFDYSKLYELFDIEDILGNILPILRYFDYPFVPNFWFSKREGSRTNDKYGSLSYTNAGLKRYMNYMNIGNLKPFRFDDSKFMTEYGDIKRIQKEINDNGVRTHVSSSWFLLSQQCSIPELFDQIDFLASLPNFSEDTLFEYLKEVNRKS